MPSNTGSEGGVGTRASGLGNRSGSSICTLSVWGGEEGEAEGGGEGGGERDSVGDGGGDGDGDGDGGGGKLPTDVGVGGKLLRESAL